MPTLIQIKNLHYHINERPILQNINLTIEKGQLITIVGPNGAGKSSLMRLILGLNKPQQGEIQRKKNLKIAYVPQSFHTPQDLPITVERFLKPLKYQKQQNPLQTLNIAHLLKSPLQNLSGGETQRLLLARAMLRKAELILLDEPAAGIDPAALGAYYRAIRNYQQQNHCSVVLISHDIHLVMAESDQVLCLNKHICCIGKPEDIAHHPEFKTLTGGDDTIGIYTHHHDHTHL